MRPESLKGGWETLKSYGMAFEGDDKRCTLTGYGEALKGDG